MKTSDIYVTIALYGVTIQTLTPNHVRTSDLNYGLILYTFAYFAMSML
jgi:hypothetical protein